MNTAYPQMMFDTSATPPTRSGSSEGSYGAPLWEQALLALWFYYTFIMRQNSELVMYPMSLYWLCAFVIHRRQLVPLAFRSWLLFGIPILAILSWAWAPQGTRERSSAWFHRL